MERRKINEVLVGAFALLGIVLLALLLFLMGTLDALFHDYAEVHADFPDVQGLQAGDPVFLFGKRVGSVLHVTLLPREGDGPAVMRAAMKIPAEYRPYLRVNSEVKIDKSLTGSLSVLILESDGPLLPAGQELAGSPAPQLGDVAEQIKAVLGEAQTLIASAGRIIKEIEEKGDLDGTLADLRGTAGEMREELPPLLRSLRETLETVGGFVEENRLDIRHTITNVKDFTADARSLLSKLENTPDGIEQALESLQSAATTIGVTVADNRGNIDDILTDLSLAASNAQNLSAEIKRRPWRLLYEPSVEELEALELYDAAWAYNEGSTQLYRSIRELADRLEKDPDAAQQPELLENAMAQVKESLSRHRQAEKLFWERLKTES